MAGPGLTPREFDLLLWCCRKRSGGELPADDFRAIDWNAFVALVRAHRVAGFVQRALAPHAAAIPAQQWDGIVALARYSAGVNLRLAAAEGQIDRGLRDAGLAPLFVKGASLGLYLYGDLSTKSSWDIDVLVAPADIPRAADRLRALGYDPVGFHQVTGGPAFERYLTVVHESLWRHPISDVHVELHSRLSRYPSLLSPLNPPAARARRSLPGTGVETFADADLFTYLCVHGALHQWHRLKWLVDIAALLEVSSTPVDDLIRHADALGVGRAVRASLMLGHEMLGCALPSETLAAIGADAGTRRLAALGRTAIMTGGDDDDAGVLAPVAKWRAHILAVPGWRRQARLAWSILQMPHVPFQLELPRALWPASAMMIGPARLAARVFRRAIGRR